MGNAADQCIILGYVSDIDKEMFALYFDFNSPYSLIDYNIETGDVMVRLLPKNTLLTSSQTDIYANMFLESLNGEYQLYKVKLGELSQNPYASTKDLTVWESRIHQTIIDFELVNGLKVKGLSDKQKDISILGKAIHINTVGDNKPLVLSNCKDLNVEWHGDFVDLTLPKELNKNECPYLVIDNIFIPLDPGQFKIMYPNSESLGMVFRSSMLSNKVTYEVSLSSLEKFLLRIKPSMDVRSYDLRLFVADRALSNPEQLSMINNQQLNSTNSVSVVAGNIYDNNGNYGLSYEEFWSEVAKDTKSSLSELSYKEKKALYAGVYAYTAIKTYTTIYESKLSSLPQAEAKAFATRASVNAMEAWAYLLDVVRKEDKIKFDAFVNELTKVDYATLGYNKAIKLNAERFFRSITEITDRNLNRAVNLAELEALKFNGKSNEVTVVVHGIGMPYLATDENNGSSWVDDVKKTFWNRNEQMEPFVWNAKDDNVPNGPVSSLDYYLRYSHLKLWNNEHKDPVLKLLNQLKLLKEKYPNKKINIIGHSLGSLIVYRLLKGIDKGDFSRTQGIVNLSYFNLGNIVLAASPVAAFEDSSTVGLNSTDADLVNIWSLKDEFYLASTAISLANKVPVPKNLGMARALLCNNLFVEYGGDIRNPIMGPINSSNIDNIQIGSDHGGMLFDINYMQEIRRIYEE